MDKLKIKNTQAGIKVFQTARGFLKKLRVIGKIAVKMPLIIKTKVSRRSSLSFCYKLALKLYPPPQKPQLRNRFQDHFESGIKCGSLKKLLNSTYLLRENKLMPKPFQPSQPPFYFLSQSAMKLIIGFFALIFVK